MSENAKEIGREIVPKKDSKGFWDIAAQAELHLGKNKSGKGLGAFLLALVAVTMLATVVFLVRSGAPVDVVESILEWWSGR